MEYVSPKYQKILTDEIDKIINDYEKSQTITSFLFDSKMIPERRVVRYVVKKDAKNEYAKGEETIKEILLNLSCEHNISYRLSYTYYYDNEVVYEFDNK